jgi:hypothetical protein
MRKYIKVQFLYNIFFYNIFFYNTNFIKNKTSTTLTNNFNFIYSFFNKKLFNYYNYNFNIFKNVNILHGFNRNPSFLSNSVIPVCFQFNNEFFFLKNLDLDFLVSDKFILDLILNKVKEIYKILIILNYYSINFKSF